MNVATREGLNEILALAHAKDVSDIKFQAHRPVMAELHGTLIPLTDYLLTTPDVEKIVDNLYGNNAGSGTVRSGVPINGAYDVRVGTQRKRFRYNATGCHAPGEGSLWVAMRTIPEIPKTLRELGVEQEIVARLRPEKGMILVTGITGSGKTTLLAAVIRHLVEIDPGNPSARSECVVTNESPIEFLFDKINKGNSMVIQQEIGRDIKERKDDLEFGGSPWAQAVSNAMRQKPTVIVNGESRDPQSFRAAITAGATGHLVYTTLHTRSVSSTVFRIINEFPSAQQNAIAIGLLANLQMIICQHLVPTTDNKRAAVREYLVFTGEIKAELLRHPPATWDGVLEGIIKNVPRETGRQAIVHLKDLYSAGRISDEDMERWEAEAKYGSLS